MGIDREKIWSTDKIYPNVIGYSPKIERDIVRGRRQRRPAFRVFVSQKIPIDMLKDDEVIPKIIDGLLVDVVEFNEHFKDEVILNGSFTLITEDFVGESRFLFHS